MSRSILRDAQGTDCFHWLHIFFKKKMKNTLLNGWFTNSTLWLGQGYMFFLITWVHVWRTDDLTNKKNYCIVLLEIHWSGINTCSSGAFNTLGLGPKLSNAASINPQINFPGITVRLPHNKDSDTAEVTQVRWLQCALANVTFMKKKPKLLLFLLFGKTGYNCLLMSQRPWHHPPYTTI